MFARAQAGLYEKALDKVTHFRTSHLLPFSHQKPHHTPLIVITDHQSRRTRVVFVSQSPIREVPVFISIIIHIENLKIRHTIPVVYTTNKQLGMKRGSAIHVVDEALERLFCYKEELQLCSTRLARLHITLDVLLASKPADRCRTT